MQLNSRQPTQPPAKRNNWLIIGGIFVGLCVICLVIGLISSAFRTATPQPTTDVNSIIDATQTSAALTVSAPMTLGAQGNPSTNTTNTIAPTNMPSPTSTSAPKNTVTPADPKTALKDTIAAALGSGDRNVPRIRGISFDAFETGDVFVEWEINDNLTNDLIKFGAADDCTKIAKAIAKSGFQYTHLTLQGYFPMQDVYGNSNDAMVINLTYSKATLDKVNWDNFILQNIYKIADTDVTDFVSPAFQNP